MNNTMKEKFPNKFFRNTLVFLMLLIIIYPVFLSIIGFKTASAEMKNTSKNILHLKDETYNYIDGILYANNNTYIYTYRTIFKYTDGEENTKEYSIVDENLNGENYYFELKTLMEYKDNIYAMGVTRTYENETTTYESIVYKVEFNDSDNTVSLQVKLKLDWNNMVIEDLDYVSEKRITDMFVDGDVLYGLCFNEYDGSQEIAQFNLNNGSAYYTDIDNCINISDYDNNKILTVTFNNDYPNEKVISCYDITNNESKELYVEASKDDQIPSCFKYNKEENTLYFLIGNEIFSVKDFDKEKKASCGKITEGYSNFITNTDDGFIIIADYQNVSMYSTDPLQANSKQLLYVAMPGYGSVGDTNYSFMKENKNVQIITAEMWSDNIIQDISSGSSDEDIYCLYSNSTDYIKLLEKGYMQDLSSSKKLSEFTENLYHFVKNESIVGNKLYYIPCEVINNALQYNEEAWIAAGLTDEDKPSTWEEFFILLNSLPDKLKENSKIDAFPSYTVEDELKYTLFNVMIQDYIAYMQKNNLQLSFDTPEIKQWFQMFENIDYEGLGILHDYTDEVISYPENEIPMCIFSESNPISVSAYIDTEPLLLKFNSEQEDFIIPTGVNILFVNPNSKNIDLAIKYIENYLDNMDITEKFELMSANNKPVKDPYYDEIINQIDEDIANLNLLIENIQGDNRKIYEDEITELNEEKEYYITTGSWMISDKSIKKYQKYTKYMYIEKAMSDNCIEPFDNPEPIFQYFDGEIDYLTLIKNLNKMI